MSARHVPPNLDLVFMVYFVIQVFTIRSVSQLLFKLGLLDLVNILIMGGTCQPDMCHLTLISFSWSIDFLKSSGQFLSITRGHSDHDCMVVGLVAEC